MKVAKTIEVRTDPIGVAIVVDEEKKTSEQVVNGRINGPSDGQHQQRAARLDYKECSSFYLLSFSMLATSGFPLVITVANEVPPSGATRRSQR